MDWLFTESGAEEGTDAGSCLAHVRLPGVRRSPLEKGSSRLLYNLAFQKGLGVKSRLNTFHLDPVVTDVERGQKREKGSSCLLYNLAFQKVQS